MSFLTDLFTDIEVNQHLREAHRKGEEKKDAFLAEDAALPADKDAVVFLDPRDGQKYRTVKMGERIWFAENFRFVPQGSELGDYTYDNDESYAAKYGCLYDWESAKALCPEGWHLPTDEEWVAMLEVAHNKASELRAASWKGSDDFGMSVHPAGVRRSADNLFRERMGAEFDLFGESAFFWSASEYNSERAMAWFTNDDYENFETGKRNIASGYSVRYVKNA